MSMVDNINRKSIEEFLKTQDDYLNETCEEKYEFFEFYDENSGVEFTADKVKTSFYNVGVLDYRLGFNDDDNLISISGTCELHYTAEALVLEGDKDFGIWYEKTGVISSEVCRAKYFIDVTNEEWELTI